MPQRTSETGTLEAADTALPSSEAQAPAAAAAVLDSAFPPAARRGLLRRRNARAGSQPASSPGAVVTGPDIDLAANDPLVTHGGPLRILLLVLAVRAVPVADPSIFSLFSYL